MAGPLVRGLFLPEEGQLWASADYAQQEPRLIVHYASLARCTGAEVAVAAYNNDPTTDYHRFVAMLGELGVRTQTGVFGARMAIDLVNDGPVTIVLG